MESGLTHIDAYAIVNDNNIQPAVGQSVTTGYVGTACPTGDVNLWYADGSVNNTSISWLIDSGANSNILSYHKFLTLGGEQVFKLNRYANTLTAANGKSIEVHGITNMIVNFDGHMFNVEVVVAEMPRIEALLGLNFLKRFRFHLDFEMGLLTNGNAAIRLRASPSRHSYEIKLAESVTVPPGQAVFVKCHSESCNFPFQQGFVDTNDDTFAALNIVCPPSLVKVYDDIVYMVVCNIGDCKQKLKAGMDAGTICSVNDVAVVHEKDDTARTDDLWPEANACVLPDFLQPTLQAAASNLGPREIEKLEKFLSNNQDVFLAPGGKLGRTSMVEHSINVAGASPIKQQLRKQSLARRIQEAECIEKMLAEGVIEPCDSPWSSPMVLVEKKDGTTRACIDFRKLNECTVKDAYALPDIQMCLDGLQGAKFFCSLDLASGYYQLGVREEDRDKTAFVSQRGLFRFTVMPFGLTNAPATFQRLMEMVLRGLQWDSCILYLDDILVMGQDFTETLQRLALVFERLRMAGLKLKTSKCSLFQKELTFLGHKVTEDGVACETSKIDAVVNWPTPQTVTDVRSFLGTTGYYRRFVPGFSDIARPLVDLTKKGQRFEWDDACQNAFQKLKQCLVEAPILASPDPAKPFILDTDASATGIGAVLSQEHDGVERPVAYASKVLSPSERAYCTTYRELLGVVTFVLHFKHYLLGAPFVIRTDHSSLRWLHNFKDADGLVGRWLAKLAVYNYKITHRRGKDHGNVDGLSRQTTGPVRRRCKKEECVDCCPPQEATVSAPEEVSTVCEMSLEEMSTQEVCDRLAAMCCPGCENTCPVQSTSWNEDTPVQSWVHGWSLEEIKKLQQDDKDVGVVLQWKLTGEDKPTKDVLSQQSQEVRALCANWPELTTVGDVLYRVRQLPHCSEEKLQLVAPQCLRQEAFHFLHTSSNAGHLGITRTVASIKMRFYWPGCKKDVTRWMRECNNCERVKEGPKYKAKLVQSTVSCFLERIAIDIVGPLPMTESGNQYILSVTDYFTKWVQAYPLPDQTAQSVADVLASRFFTTFGCPKEIHSDQGRNFESHLFQQLCKLFGIRKTRTTPYNPKSDGLCERWNKTMQQMLKCLGDEDGEWDEKLPYVVMAYNSTPQESTGLSPRLMVYGSEMPVPLDVMVGIPEGSKPGCEVQYVEWLRQSLKSAHDFARKKLMRAATKQKRHYDSRSKPYTYSIGDIVWRWYAPAANRKLGVGWQGPYQVVATPTEVNVQICKEPGDVPLMVHIDHLKPYLGVTPKAWAPNEVQSTPPSAIDSTHDLESKMSDINVSHTTTEARRQDSVEPEKTMSATELSEQAHEANDVDVLPYADSGESQRLTTNVSLDEENMEEDTVQRRSKRLRKPKRCECPDCM